MILRSLVLASAALYANAALVVPDVQGEVASTPEADASHLDPVQVLDTKQQQVSLRCAECPFPEVGENGKVSWIDGFETSLLLNLSVEGDALLANGGQIFPPPPMHISAVQRRESDGEESEPIALGNMLEVMPEAASTEEPAIELSTIRLTILDLDGHPVPLNTIVIALIRDPAGELYIVNAGIEETTPDRWSWRQCRGKPSCLRKLLFSRVRALLASTKARMLEMGSKFGCHDGPPHPPHHGPPHPPHHGPPHPPHHPPHHGEHPPPPPHHGPGGPHHHRTPFERAFARVIRFVVIPAALGVLAGLAASALGMLVGQLIVTLWLRYRRPATEQSPVQLEEGTDSEKEALVTEELPPKYEEEGEN